MTLSTLICRLLEQLADIKHTNFTKHSSHDTRLYSLWCLVLTSEVDYSIVSLYVRNVVTAVTIHEQLVASSNILWYIIIMVLSRWGSAVQLLVAVLMSSSSSSSSSYCSHCSITCVLSALYITTVEDSSITYCNTITHFGGSCLVAVLYLPAL